MTPRARICNTTISLATETHPTAIQLSKSRITEHIGSGNLTFRVTRQKCNNSTIGINIPDDTREGEPRGTKEGGEKYQNAKT